MGEVWEKHHRGFIEQDSVVGDSSSHDVFFDPVKVNLAQGISHKGGVRGPGTGAPVHTVQVSCCSMTVLVLRISL